MAQTKVRKAVILVAGLGTRFLPITKAIPKAMLPVVDKPVIQHLVEEAVASGIEEIIIVLGPGQDAVRKHFEDHPELEQELTARGKHEHLDHLSKIKDFNVSFITQEQPLGDGHAILQAKDALAGEPFAVLFGDDIIDAPTPALAQLLAVYEKSVTAGTPTPIICAEEVPLENISKYGVIDGDLSPDGTVEVRGLVEKPAQENAPSNLGVIGKYVCTPEVLSALEESQASHSDGEIRLIDGFITLLKNASPVQALKVEGTRYDTGNKEGWLKANIELAKKMLTLFICITLLSGCSLTQEKPGEEPAAPHPGVTQEEVEEEIAEPVETEPVDWEIISETEDKIVLHAEIENPNNGVMLSSYLVTPNHESISRAQFSAVMLIPGGTDYGSNSFGKNAKGEVILLGNNIAYAYFDPDGRGESEGEEDANGAIHQDGLLAVSLAVAEHPAIDTDDFGLVSYSYGTTMAAGMLGRYPGEHPFKWYVDWEGPSAREYTTSGCDVSKESGKHMDRNLAVECNDNEFWLQRESVNYLPNLEIPYLRIQNINDHVQESNEHAIDAINAATEGTSPWTRINDEDPNQTFTYETPPTYLNNKAYDFYDYVLEMFELF